MINTSVILPCCFLLSLLFAGFVVECGATIARHCRRRLCHISPDQGPRLMCECKLKRFPWGRAVLITKFEEDSSYNCVLRTVCPNAPNGTVGSCTYKQSNFRIVWIVVYYQQIVFAITVTQTCSNFLPRCSGKILDHHRLTCLFALVFVTCFTFSYYDFNVLVDSGPIHAVPGSPFTFLYAKVSLV